MKTEPATTNRHPGRNSQLRGLWLEVLHSPRGDFTNGGISAHVDDLALVGIAGCTARGDTGRRVIAIPRDCRVVEPADGCPAVALEIRRIGRYVPSLIPVTINEDGTIQRTHTWTMLGGNYAVGDSRLSELVENLTATAFYGAIAIHDRDEHH